MNSQDFSYSNKDDSQLIVECMTRNVFVFQIVCQGNKKNWALSGSCKCASQNEYDSKDNKSTSDQQAQNKVCKE